MDTVLRKFSLFQGLSDADLEGIDFYLQPSHYAAGEVIFNLGEPGDQVFFIESGQVVVFDPVEANIAVRTFGEGSMFGELAVIDRKPRTLSARAEKDCQLWALSGGDFARVILDNKTLLMDILVSLSASVRYTTDIFKEATRRSIHDALTGLYNRSLFDALVSVLGEGHRQEVTVIMVDIDGLKKFNDRYGHAEGDKLIRGTADVLRSAFRADDVVARVGGDEFAILLPGAGVEACEQAVTRIRSRLEAYNEQHPDFPISFSLGGATGSTDTPVTEIIKEADARMYAEKQHANRGEKA